MRKAENKITQENNADRENVGKPEDESEKETKNNPEAIALELKGKAEEKINKFIHKGREVIVVIKNKADNAVAETDAGEIEAEADSIVNEAEMVNSSAESGADDNFSSFLKNLKLLTLDDIKDIFEASENGPDLQMQILEAGAKAEGLLVKYKRMCDLYGKDSANGEKVEAFEQWEKAKKELASMNKEYFSDDKETDSAVAELEDLIRQFSNETTQKAFRQEYQKIVSNKNAERKIGEFKSKLKEYLEDEKRGKYLSDKEESGVGEKETLTNPEDYINDAYNLILSELKKGKKFKWYDYTAGLRLTMANAGFSHEQRNDASYKLINRINNLTQYDIKSNKEVAEQSASEERFRKARERFGKKNDVEIRKIIKAEKLEELKEEFQNELKEIEKYEGQGKIAMLENLLIKMRKERFDDYEFVAQVEDELEKLKQTDTGRLDVSAPATQEGGAGVLSGEEFEPSAEEAEGKEENLSLEDLKRKRNQLFSERVRLYGRDRERVEEINSELVKIEQLIKEKEEEVLAEEPIMETVILGGKVEAEADEKETAEAQIINNFEKINKKFESEFNIKREDLENLDFYSLTEGQQFLVLENLQQLVLGRIHEEALQEGYIKGYRREKGKFWTNANENTKIFLGNVWRGISKKYQIAQTEKKKAEKIAKGGFEMHGEVLRQLINGLKAYGPEVEMRNGKIEIQFATGLGEQYKLPAEEFNRVANEFCRMPYEWSLQTADKEEREKYKKTKRRYEEAKKEILNILEEQAGEKNACLKINEIEGQIQINQFLNSHPEVEEQLQKIKDKKVWLRALRGTLQERGLYFGVGFITRQIAVGVSGLIGAPVAAAVMGGWIARKRGRENLEEREILARIGIEDNSKIAKDFVDAKYLHESIDFLLEKLKIADENADEVYRSLKFHIEDAKNKLDNGTVNFGKSEERLYNQYELIKKVSEGFVYLKQYDLGSLALPEKEIDGVKKSRTFDSEYKEDVEVINKFLKKQGAELQKAQKKYLNNQMIHGALLGAGFAVAGHATRNYFFSRYQTWQEQIKGGKASTVPRTDVAGKAQIEQPITGGKTGATKATGAVRPEAGEITGTPREIGGATPEVKGTAGQFVDVEIKGKTDTFSEAIYNAAKQSDAKTQNNFIHKVLGDKIKIDEGNRSELLSRSVRRLSVANLEEADPNVKNLLYEGNTVRLKQDGSWEVLKGQGIKDARAVEEAVLHRNPERVHAAESARGPRDAEEIGAPEVADNIAPAQTEGVYGIEDKELDSFFGQKMSYSVKKQNGEMFVYAQNSKGEVIEGVKPVKITTETPGEIAGKVKNEIYNWGQKQTEQITNLGIKADAGNLREYEAAGINPFAKGGLSQADHSKLEFWSRHQDELAPKDMKRVFEISERSEINFQSNESAFVGTYKKMPASIRGNDGAASGFMKVFAGQDEAKAGGLKELLGMENAPKFQPRPDGVIVVKDAYGYKDFDIIINDKCIGVDGPGKGNWGIKSRYWGLGEAKPVNDLNIDNINRAKTEIADMDEKIKILTQKRKR